MYMYMYVDTHYALTIESVLHSKPKASFLIVQYIQVSAKLVLYVRRRIPTLSDPSLEVLLTTITKYTTSRLASLRSTIAKVKVHHLNCV